MMLGGVICGYCAMGRLKTATPPASVMTMDSTAAKIGRSMKKSREQGRSSEEGRGGEQFTVFRSSFSLWHGLPTVPPDATEGLQIVWGVTRSGDRATTGGARGEGRAIHRLSSLCLAFNFFAL